MQAKTIHIGILGGTFNPVHLGHLILAQNAVEILDLSTLIFLPCASPPHKDVTTAIAPAHRLAMLELALADHAAFSVSDLEIQRGGTSYTIDSVTELAQRHTNARMSFLIGSDSLRELHQWKDIDRLLEL